MKAWTFMMLAGALLAQEPAKFEVASVKAAGAPSNPGVRIDDARVEIGYGSIAFLVATAYRVELTRVDGPDWINTQRFDIQAKLPEGTKKEQVPEMLRALLVDRFRLAAHRQQKEETVYALVTDPGGSKLQASAAGAGDSAAQAAQPGRQVLTVIHGTDGLETVSRINGATVFAAETISLADLALFVARYVELPVIDRTGLQGTYQVSMNVPDRALRRNARNSDPPTTEAQDADVVSIFSSVRHLGLPLEKQKAPLDYVVIDHVEKAPTEN